MTNLSWAQPVARSFRPPGGSSGGAAVVAPLVHPPGGSSGGAAVVAPSVSPAGWVIGRSSGRGSVVSPAGWVMGRSSGRGSVVSPAGWVIGRSSGRGSAGSPTGWVIWRCIIVDTWRSCGRDGTRETQLWLAILRLDAGRAIRVPTQALVETAGSNVGLEDPQRRVCQTVGAEAVESRRHQACSDTEPLCIGMDVQAENTSGHRAVRIPARGEHAHHRSIGTFGDQDRHVGLSIAERATPQRSCAVWSEHAHDRGRKEADVGRSPAGQE